MKKNKNIAIGISTFLRDESLFKLIKSILQYSPEFRIYIVDQGYSTPFKKTIYKGLQEQGHIIKYIPFDSGISKSRYILKEICKEPYLVFMEDDFEVTINTNLYKLKEILDENPHLGVVGGNLQGYAKTGAYSFFLDYADDKICYFPLDYLVEKNLAKWQETSSGIKFLEATIVSDFTMWRKEVPNIFDENVKTIEHTHVYLLVKYKTKYKVAFCPDSEIKHSHDKTDTNYNNFRGRKADLDYLVNYWKISDFYKFDKRSLSKLENQTNTIIPEICISKPIIKIDNNKKEIEKIPITSICTNENTKNKIISILDYLQKNNIDFWLLKESCLETILKKEILSDKLCIGVHSIDIKNHISQQFSNCEDLLFIYVDCKRTTKLTKLYNQNIKVPCPVVRYLENTFKKTWEELKNE